MADGEGHLLARLLARVFHRRRSCATAVFSGILVLVLVLMLARARSADEALFPILGLGFVLLVVLGYVLRALRGGEGAGPQQDAGPSIPDATPPESPLEPPAVSPWSSTVGSQPLISNPVRLGLMAGFVAAAAVPPILCLLGIGAAFLPGAAEGTAEALGYLVGAGLVVATPSAALAGAMAGYLLARRAAGSTERAGWDRRALWLGGLIGALIAFVSVLIAFGVLCLDRGLCPV